MWPCPASPTTSGQRLVGRSSGGSRPDDFVDAIHCRKAIGVLEQPARPRSAVVPSAMVCDTVSRRSFSSSSEEPSATSTIRISGPRCDPAAYSARGHRLDVPIRGRRHSPAGSDRTADGTNVGFVPSNSIRIDTRNNGCSAARAAAARLRKPDPMCPRRCTAPRRLFAKPDRRSSSTFPLGIAPDALGAHRGPWPNRSGMALMLRSIPFALLIGVPPCQVGRWTPCRV